MNEYAEFSNQIEQYVKTYKQGVLGRALLLFKFLWYWKRNTPLPFGAVVDEGAPVGNTVTVRYLRMHDMEDHAIRGRLTTAVLLRGLRANAFSCLSYRNLGEGLGEVTIQPRWV